MFAAARGIELQGSPRGGYSFSQEAADSTLGIAPAVGEALVDLEVWWAGTALAPDAAPATAAAPSEGILFWGMDLEREATDVLIIPLLCLLLGLLYLYRGRRRAV